MTIKKQTFLTIISISVFVISCTNNKAEFNNKLFDIHTSFQNEIKNLDEKLNTDSITTDSANIYLLQTEKNCKLQYDTLLLLKPTTEGIALYNAAKNLFDKQLYSIVLQKRMMLNGEPGKDFSDMQDSLDATTILIDSLDVKLKATQIEFAKNNNFKLQ